MLVLCLLLTLIVVCLIYWYASKPKNLPPGPSGFPIVGSLPQILWNRRRLNVYFSRLAQKYGSVVCLRVMSKYVIMLDDVDSVREAFSGKNGHLFSGRCLRASRRFVTRGKGILSLESEALCENRRFILQTLRDFSMSREFYDTRINAEATLLCSHLLEHRHGTDAHEVGRPVAESIMANMAHILFGCPFTRDEVEFLMRELQIVSQVSPNLFIINASKCLTSLCEWKFVRHLLGLERVIQQREPLLHFIANIVRKHHAEQQEEGTDEVKPSGDSLPTDFVHAYLMEQKRREGTEMHFWFDDDQIVAACLELLVAGVETTRNTLLCSFLLLAQHPHIQEEVHSEIMTVLGSQRLACVRDVSQMPRTEATILEVLRISSLVPLGVAHATTEPTHLFGYFIPAHTAVVPNLHRIAHNSKVWKNPKGFDPFVNFFNAASGTLVNRDKVLPFSTGRRSCIGESLARAEVFLYLVRVLQMFRISMPPESPEVIRVVSDDVILRQCTHTHFVFTPRTGDSS